MDRAADVVDFPTANRLRERNGGAFFQHRKTGNFILALKSGRQTDPAKGKTFLTYSIWKPEAAYHSYIHESELTEKYRVARPEQVVQWWKARYAAAPRIETKHVHIIAGAIVPLWQRLKTEEDARLRVTRVSTGDGQRIVGVTIPATKVKAVLRSIGLGPTPSNDPESIFKDVLDDDDEISLVSGLHLKRAKLHGSWAIELICTNMNRFRELRSLGLINEQIKFKQRFFVPTDKVKGLPILSKLLTKYPVMPTEEQEGEQGSLPALIVEPVKPVIVDLEQWVIQPEEKAPEPFPEVIEASITEIPAPITPIELWGEPQLPEAGQPFLWDLADTYVKSSGRRKARQRPAVQEQGLLFSLQ